MVNAIKRGTLICSDRGVLIRDARSLGILHFDHTNFVSARAFITQAKN